MRINLLSLKRKELNRNMTYARYLMSVKSGTEPVKGMEVDHIDGDRTNDLIANLQIISREANLKKMTSEPRQVSKKVVYRFKCLHCGSIFTRDKRKVGGKEPKHNIYCSKTCGGFSTSHVHEKQEFSLVPQPVMVEKFVQETWEHWSAFLTPGPVKMVVAIRKDGTVCRVKEVIEKVCLGCRNKFNTKQPEAMFCCVVCAKRSKEKAASCDKKEAVHKILNGMSTWRAEAAILGLSDSGLHKWAKRNGLIPESERKSKSSRT